jgi:hypothetical protein
MIRKLFNFETDFNFSILANSKYYYKTYNL